MALPTPPALPKSPLAPAAAKAPAAPASLDGPEVVHEDFDDTGWLKSRTSMRGTTLHGPMQVFSADGVPSLEANHEAGKRQGLQRVYDDKGQLVQEADYHADLQEGITKIFAGDKLLYEQRFVKGLLNGETVAYAECGDVTARLRFLAGGLEGESLFYNETALIRRAKYHKGKLEGETLDYARDGSTVQSAQYRANVLNGPMKRFWPDGTVMEEIIYKNGKPLGAPRRFDAHGVEQGAAKGAGFLKNFEKLVRG